MVSGSSVGCNVPIGAPAAAGSEGHGFCGGRLRCQCPAPVGHHYTAVEPLLDLHLSASVAGPVVIRQYLDGGAVEAHGVVVGHSAEVLEAEDRIEADAGWELAIGRA